MKLKKTIKINFPLLRKLHLNLIEGKYFPDSLINSKEQMGPEMNKDK